MQQLLIYSQVAISFLLVVSILMQNRGSGLSAAFGGDFGGFHTKRGSEKVLYITTIVLGTLFVLNSLANVLLTTVSGR